MKNLELVIIFFLLLFVQQLLKDSNCCEQQFATGHLKDNRTSFEPREDYKHLMGILPTEEVFFNVIQEAFSINLVHKKIKEPSEELIPLKAKKVFNYSYLSHRGYSRYCSAFIQIFLRTACFRI